MLRYKDGFSEAERVLTKRIVKLQTILNIFVKNISVFQKLYVIL